MALIAIASDKGAPGVTTAALALAAVWPRPVLLAECDPAGGDLVYRFPAVGGGHLDPRRGVLSLAVMARRGMQPQQLWEHTQKLHGGLDVLAGVTNAEQGAGLSLLWGPIGKVLASLPQADVIADCGRLGADGPLYDLLAEATNVILVTRVHVADVIRLRDRSVAFAAAAQSRGRRGFGVGVVVVADHKKFRASLGEVQHVLAQAGAPATVLGGIAHDTKGADLLSGEWGGNLDRTALIKTAREVARQLTGDLPPIGTADPAAAHNPDVEKTGPQPMLPPSFRGASAGLRPEVPPSFRPPPATAPAPVTAAAPTSRPPNYAPPPPVSATRAAAAPASAPDNAAYPATAYPATASPARSAAVSPPAAASAAGVPATADTTTPATVSEPRDPAPRTAFNRVLGGRSGRHHSGQEQTARPASRPSGRPPGSPGAHAADSLPRTQDAPAAGISAPEPQAAAGWTAGSQVAEPTPPALRPGASADGPESGFSWRTISARSNNTHREAPSGGDPARGDHSHGDPLRDDPLRDDPLRDDPLRDDPLRADPLRDDQLRGAPSGGTAFGGPWLQNATTRDTATSDAATRDAASRDTSFRDAAFRGPQQQPGDPGPPRPAARHAAGSSQAASGYSRPPMSPLTPPSPAFDPAQRSAIPPGSAAAAPDQAAAASSPADTGTPQPAGTPQLAGTPQPAGTPQLAGTPQPAGDNGAPGTAEAPRASRQDDRDWDVPSWPSSGPMDPSRPGGG